MPPRRAAATDSVEALLSSLDGLPSSPAPSSAAAAPGSAAPAATGGDARKDAQSLLDEMDDLVQRRAPTPRSASSAAPRTASPAQTTPLRSSLASGASAAPTATAGSVAQPPAPLASQPAPPPPAAAAPAQSSSWSPWASAWSSATKLAESARAELEKLEKHAPEQARGLGAKGWGIAQGVKGLVQEGNWEKIGGDLTAASRRGLEEIINAVAPPIAAHEVIQVALSHDMVGYDGISDVVFQVLQRVMETQHVAARSGGGSEQQLVVNRAPGAVRHSSDGGVVALEGENEERAFHAVRGWDAAAKRARAAIAELVEGHEAPAPSSSSVALPITHCPVFVRIQPVLAPLPFGAEPTASSSAAAEQFSFIVMLHDPTHACTHETLSQSVPAAWLQIPFEENAWVEQALVDVLQGALSAIGQDYVYARQTGRTRREAELRSAEAGATQPGPAQPAPA
ncbi:hypothetical protein FA09DRAFT_360340 [Tilletiopsis washingtonensis]|uniref:Maintenance of telomere capping protein 1 n=1 Tax=Tilletiopsis washingtonensis TaxID=58919 RepID=A0A316ZEB8_9BASI|nr:hypothetical protein FA09DRAFT_360340 [Tilletiopsis washingtonensis]PWN98635.1 hypothetical protein FA09DRAFT_360340 [Tilletiopsis washingtonensis]